MISFCYFCKKNYFAVRRWPKLTPFERKQVYQFFFRTTGLQHKLLILIEPPNIFFFQKKKWFGAKLRPTLRQKAKKLTLSIAFFHILHREYI